MSYVDHSCDGDGSVTGEKTHFDGFLLHMVNCKLQALNKIGLRVVMDVVYNHLHASGPFDENSILDKVVFVIFTSLEGCLKP